MKVKNHTNSLYLCALMNRLLIILTLIGTLGMGGCKSSFEKLRAGGNYAEQLKASLSLYQKKDYQKSQILFEALMPQMRGKAEAEQVYFYYAYTHYYLGKFVTASYYFKQFSTTFQNSEWKEEAEYMSAYSNYLLSPSYRLEQSNTDKGIEGLQTFINTYPESTRVPKCNKLIEELRGKLEQKAYAEGQLYFDLGQFQSAIQSFENVLKDFPETRRVEEIRYMVVKSAYHLAENSVYEKKAERYALVQDRCTEFLRRHPTSKLKKEVQALSKESEEIIKTLKK